MRASRPGSVVFLRATLPLLAGLSMLLAGAALRPAGAAPASSSAAPSQVALGAHRFGHLRQPDAIVAKAGPDEVTFVSPPPGADGLNFGPMSFDVTRDGSVWLLDGADKQRLLVWQPGRPSRPARAVALPDDPLERIADFAIGRDGTIYASYVPPPGPGPKTLRLAAVDPSGKVRWTAATIIEIFNSQLRIGPDGALYVFEPFQRRWVPLTSPAGRPLPVAEQRRRSTARQPLPGGRWLTATRGSQPRWEVTLGQGDGALRSWRVTSDTELGALATTPTVVGGDPVLVVGISRQTSDRFLYEYEVLRLAPGGTRQRFSIAPATRVVWGDDPITGVRVGPDGALYQLRTDNKTGVTIARYSLGPVQAAAAAKPATGSPQPTTSPQASPQPSTPVAVQPPATAAPTALPATPTAGQSSTRRLLLPGLVALGAAALAAVAAWQLYRRRERVAGS